MNISQFATPTEHPYFMLDGAGLKHTFECESLLAWILMRCIEVGGFIPIKCKHSHPSLVSAGFLVESGKKVYSLTKKAKGYLYAYYGVE